LRDHCAKILIVCCLFFVTKLAHAQSIDKLYIQRCASCHGPEALGKLATSAPALAGQQAEYLERQLGHFVSGLRGRHKKDAYGAAMAPWALSLGEQSKRQEMANYLATLTPLTEKNIADDADLDRGKKYYQANCGSCHGAQAQGNVALNSPGLVGLQRWYLERQYQYFIDGLRGADKQDKFGRQMQLVASRLTDEALITDILAYIDSLP